MSRQDKLNPPEIDDGHPVAPVDDDWLQIELRLGLDEVAAAEEERLRHAPRRRPTRHQLAQLALKLYDARRGRDRIFRDRLFGEPAWDILLALYGLPSRGVCLGVTSLGHAANVPPTTSLRWQNLLTQEGMIERGPLVRDSRKQLVRLTDKGRNLMDKYLLRLFYSEDADTE